MLKSKQDIIEVLAEEARKSWPGSTGEGRAANLIEFLNKKLTHYSKCLNFSEEDILSAMEAKRDYCANNYYQEANFPDISDVTIFQTREDFISAYPSKKYRCPSCKGESTNPYECNATPIDDQKQCNWKSYGLFGTMGKGLRIVVRNTFLEHPVVHEIFMPLEAELTQEAI